MLQQSVQALKRIKERRGDLGELSGFEFDSKDLVWQSGCEELGATDIVEGLAVMNSYQLVSLDHSHFGYLEYLKAHHRRGGRL